MIATGQKNAVDERENFHDSNLFSYFSPQHDECFFDIDQVSCPISDFAVNAVSPSKGNSHSSIVHSSPLQEGKISNLKIKLFSSPSSNRRIKNIDRALDRYCYAFSAIYSLNTPVLFVPSGNNIPLYTR